MSVEIILTSLRDLLDDFLENPTESITEKDYGLCGYIEWAWDGNVSIEYRANYECLNLPYGCTSVRGLVKRLMSNWPEGTGKCDFPIPSHLGDKCLYMARMTYYSKDKWSGDQLKMRISLANYILDELNQLLKNQGNKDEI